VTSEFALRLSVGFSAKTPLGLRRTHDRKIHSITIQGTRQDAQKALTTALAARHSGRLVDASKITVGEHIAQWLDGAGVSPKTLERYRQLTGQQIIPHLGAIPLQKLRPADVQRRHQTLLKAGGKDSKSLSARTVGHAHRVLHRALASAATAEIVARNVVGAIRPPKVEAAEIAILSSVQIGDVLTKLEGHPLYTITVLALAAGMRRGELLALQWGDVNGASIQVERSLEETKAGLRFKPPKTKHGRRVITLPAKPSRRCAPIAASN
jgi:integrase